MTTNQQQEQGKACAATERAEVGLFLTLTVPGRFHRSRRLPGGKLLMNAAYDGSTPRDAQLWLRSMWTKARAALARQGVRMRGVRVAEPHHDATPHWHALIWADDEAGAQAIEATVRKYWLSDAGDERGARRWRVKVVRVASGTAAEYVAELTAWSPVWLPRADAWAETWGIRRFHAFGLQGAAVWRELFGVSAKA